VRRAREGQSSAQCSVHSARCAQCSVHSARCEGRALDCFLRTKMDCCCSAANGFVLLTHDLDFGAILASSGANIPSVIQIRTEDLRPEVLAGRDSDCDRKRKRLARTADQRQATPEGHGDTCTCSRRVTGKGERQGKGKRGKRKDESKGQTAGLGAQKRRKCTSGVQDKGGVPPPFFGSTSSGCGAGDGVGFRK